MGTPHRSEYCGPSISSSEEEKKVDPMINGTLGSLAQACHEAVLGLYRSIG